MVSESSRPNLQLLVANATRGDAAAREELLGLYRPYLRLAVGAHPKEAALHLAMALDKLPADQRTAVRAAATLDHPNIVAVHSVGSEDNVHYYAMQLIHGPSLAQVIGTLQPLPR